MAQNLVDAICAGHEELAREILLGELHADIDCSPPNGPGPALFCCCIRGYLPLAILLLERRADVDSRNENWASPLHGAVDNGHHDLVKLLLQHKADVNAQTRRGDTPLHLAAYRGFLHIAHSLVQHGADLTLVNHNSMTPEMEAAGQGHKELENYLGAVYEVLYPDGEKSQRSRTDSLIHLDPPSLVASPGQSHIGEKQALIQEEQQTKLLWRKPSSCLGSHRDVSLWQPVQDGPSHGWSKQPLQEQQNKVYDGQSCAWGPGEQESRTVKNAHQHHLQYQQARQPQQQDENTDCKIQGPQHCLSEHHYHQQRSCLHHSPQLQQQQQQQQQRMSPTLSYQHPFHQQQYRQQPQEEPHGHRQNFRFVGQTAASHPRHPMSFTQFNPVIPTPTYQQQQQLGGVPQTLVQPGVFKTVANSSAPPAVFQTAFRNTTASVPTHIHVTDPFHQSVRLVKSHPEAISYHDNFRFTNQSVSGVPHAMRRLASMDSTGSAFSDSSSGSGRELSVNSMMLSIGSGSDLCSMVLSGESETKEGSEDFSHLSSVLSPSYQQSPRVHGSSKVIRSKSLIVRPASQGMETHKDVWKVGGRDLGVRGAARSCHILDTSSDILRNFEPVGPPPLSLTSDSLDIHHSSLFSLASLRSTGSDPLLSGRQSSSKTRLGRSASSSPCVGNEAISRVRQSPPGPDIRPDALANQVDGRVYRRCSLDDEVFKNNLGAASGQGCVFRRLSVTGGGNVDCGGCRPTSAGVGDCERSLVSLQRNQSCESDYYGSGEVSLESSISSFAPSIISTADSGTSFGSGMEDAAPAPSPNKLTSLSPTPAEHTTLKSTPAAVDLSRLLPAPHILSRHHSFPTPNTAGNDINTCNTSSRYLSKLNDLSASSAREDESNPSGSVLFPGTHRSMPPLMTCINIPFE